MRNRQAGLVHDLVAVHEQVEVDRSRPPALAAHPAEALLDGEQSLQQLPRAEIRLEPDNAVEERPLLDGPDRLGLADLRDGGDVDAVLLREQLDGAPQVLLTVTEIGADTAERRPRHWRSVGRHAGYRGAH